LADASYPNPEDADLGKYLLEFRDEYPELDDRINSAVEKASVEQASRFISDSFHFLETVSDQIYRSLAET